MLHVLCFPFDLELRSCAHHVDILWPNEKGAPSKQNNILYDVFVARLGTFRSFVVSWTLGPVPGAQALGPWVLARPMRVGPGAHRPKPLALWPLPLGPSALWTPRAIQN